MVHDLISPRGELDAEALAGRVEDSISMNERLGIRILIVLGIMVLTVWIGREMWDIVTRLGTVLTLFFCAWLISFVLSPPTNGLVRLGVRRPLAVFSVYVLVVTFLVIVVTLLAPRITSQIGQLLDLVNAYTAQTPGMLMWAEEQARAWGVSDAELRDFYRGIVDQARNITGLVLQNMLGLFTGAATLLVNIVFCLIISVYMMLDGRRIMAGAVQLIPRRYRHDAHAVFDSIDLSFGGYIRGQLILAIAYGLGVAGVMAVAGLDYKALSSIFAGVAMVIPFVGPFISLVPPILVAILSSPDQAWWIILLLIVMQQVVLNVVAPRVFGHTVKMHPLLVIAAAMTGAAIAGVWGALFGIPVVGILASIVRRYYLLQRERDTEQDSLESPEIVTSNGAAPVSGEMPVAETPLSPRGGD